MLAARIANLPILQFLTTKPHRAEERGPDERYAGYWTIYMRSFWNPVTELSFIEQFFRRQCLKGGVKPEAVSKIQGKYLINAPEALARDPCIVTADICRIYALMQPQIPGKSVVVAAIPCDHSVDFEVVQYQNSR